MNKVKILNPQRHEDQRGFFSEIWSKRNLSLEGIDLDFVQDNMSFSSDINTIRGLHLQIPPYEQAKIIRCSKGRILDFASDIRKDSPDYCKFISEELSFVNGKQLFIPAGFLHGFITLENNSEVCYKCSGYYSKEHEVTIKYDDPDLNIIWPKNNLKSIISEKDMNGISFKDFMNPFYYKWK